MDWLEQSEALHARVRAFAAGHAGAHDTFEELALAIAEFQARHSPGFARLVRAHASRLDSLASIPAVPSEAFRVARVAVHAPEQDEVRFQTSGTTGAPGIHAMRSTRTYRELSLRFGRVALASAWPGPHVVVALAPPPDDPPSSSLGFMLHAFMQEFDGRVERGNSALAQRWLAGPGGIEVDGLARAAAHAIQRREPLMVLATSLALALLLESLGDRSFPVPSRTVVMQTGGSKGRTRAVDPEVLRRQVARAFGISPAQVVGEYGMTELTSQLYEGTLPGGELKGDPGVYLPPAWLRVTAVDPATLEPVDPGEAGIARFVDLGNVDSALAVVTQDLVRIKSGGIELLGRRAGAEPRGCSLALEALVAPVGRARPG